MTQVNDRTGAGHAGVREALESRKSTLEARLSRIKANVRRGFNADSGEQAKELEDAEVVDALGNEARTELQEISDALQRIADETYGFCLDCGEAISPERLQAMPMVKLCIDCANEAERHQA